LGNHLSAPAFLERKTDWSSLGYFKYDFFRNYFGDKFFRMDNLMTTNFSATFDDTSSAEKESITTLFSFNFMAATIPA